MHVRHVHILSGICLRLAHQHLENLAHPLFIVHGAQDQYTPISGLHYMLQRAKEVDKDGLFHVSIYDDEGHQLSSEEHIREAYQKIAKFMDGVTG